MSYTSFHRFRSVLAVAMVVYAAISVYRFASPAGGYPLEVVLWTLLPPLWFFGEYYVFDRGLIALPAGMVKADFPESLKNYADYASKIWAAVLAAILFFASNGAVVA